MRDLFNHIHPVVAIAPAAATTDNTAWASGWIDRKSAGLLASSLTFLLITGALIDADATFAVTMQHADNDDQSDAAAVSAADLIGTLALAGFNFGDDNETRKIGYSGDKRYVKITVTPSNNTGNAFLSVIALLGHLSRTAPNPPV